MACSGQAVLCVTETITGKPLVEPHMPVFFKFIATSVHFILLHVFWFTQWIPNTCLALNFQNIKITLLCRRHHAVWPWLACTWTYPFKTAEICSNTKMINEGCFLMQLHYISISLYLTIAPCNQYQSHWFPVTCTHASFHRLSRDCGPQLANKM